MNRVVKTQHSLNFPAEVFAAGKFLSEAMEQGRSVNFVYDGKIRVVEVHAIGTSTKDGSLVMRGYQVAGHASRPLPIWSLYTIEKIETLTLGTEASLAPRPGYKRGDKQMDTILVELLGHG